MAIADRLRLRSKSQKATKIDYLDWLESRGGWRRGISSTFDISGMTLFRPSRFTASADAAMLARDGRVLLMEFKTNYKRAQGEPRQERLFDPDEPRK